jgi:hypothetical protein
MGSRVGYMGDMAGKGDSALGERHIHPLVEMV